MAIDNANDMKYLLGSSISLWADHMSSLIPDDSNEAIDSKQIALMKALKDVFDSDTHADAISFMKKAKEVDNG
tara:strand:- start:2804 stop:3022 length:219 start_codon:yes stop_codon:yes gene_type:complete